MSRAFWSSLPYWGYWATQKFKMFMFSCQMTRKMADFATFIGSFTEFCLWKGNEPSCGNKLVVLLWFEDFTDDLNSFLEGQGKWEHRFSLSCGSLYLCSIQLLVTREVSHPIMTYWRFFNQVYLTQALQL